jgi:hypothetical protein
MTCDSLQPDFVDTLTATLRRVVSDIVRLPADEQDAIAHELQVPIEEREWNALVRSPKSQHLLRRLAADVCRQ